MGVDVPKIVAALPSEHLAAVEAEIASVAKSCSELVPTHVNAALMATEMPSVREYLLPQFQVELRTVIPRAYEPPERHEAERKEDVTMSGGQTEEAATQGRVLTHVEVVPGSAFAAETSVAGTTLAHLGFQRLDQEDLPRGALSQSVSIWVRYGDPVVDDDQQAAAATDGGAASEGPTTPRARVAPITGIELCRGEAAGEVPPLRCV